MKIFCCLYYLYNEKGFKITNLSFKSVIGQEHYILGIFK